MALDSRRREPRPVAAKVLVTVGLVVTGGLIAAVPSFSVVGLLYALVVLGLVVGGIIEILGKSRYRRPSRAAAIVRGLALVSFGLAACLHVDVTILASLVVVGVRLVAFGLAELTSVVSRRQRRGASAPRLLRAVLTFVVALAVLAPTVLTRGGFCM